jgi:hypothetical protein
MRESALSEGSVVCEIFHPDDVIEKRKRLWSNAMVHGRRTQTQGHRRRPRLEFPELEERRQDKWDSVFSSTDKENIGPAQNCELDTEEMVAKTEQSEFKTRMAMGINHFLT